MVRMSLIIIAINLTVSLCAQEKLPVAKNKNNCSCGFQTMIQGGLLEGARGASWHLQTVNGAYYKTWFAGVGVGLDYYSMRTIPLFLDLRKDLFKNKRTPFLYADAGIHFDWLKTKEKPGWGSSEYDRGFYYDAGVGYKIALGNRDALQVSTGYTMKRLREERSVVPWCIQPPCNPSKEYYNYSFSRISFKVGWQFK
jgi:hypothetical protein